jgi:hypothetical protein
MANLEAQLQSTRLERDYLLKELQIISAQQSSPFQALSTDRPTYQSPPPKIIPVKTQTIDPTIYGQEKYRAKDVSFPPLESNKKDVTGATQEKRVDRDKELTHKKMDESSQLWPHEADSRQLYESLLNEESHLFAK